MSLPSAMGTVNVDALMSFVGGSAPLAQEMSDLNA